MTDAGTSGRDHKGRFAAGNPGGPGNPFVNQVHLLRTAIFSRIKKGELQKVVDALFKSAKDGDIAAAKLILSYAAGTPEVLHREIDINERERALREALDHADSGDHGATDPGHTL